MVPKRTSHHPQQPDVVVRLSLLRYGLARRRQIVTSEIRQQKDTATVGYLGGLGVTWLTPYRVDHGGPLSRRALARDAERRPGWFACAVDVRRRRAGEAGTSLRLPGARGEYYELRRHQ